MEDKIERRIHIDEDTDLLVRQKMDMTTKEMQRQLQMVSGIIEVIRKSKTHLQQDEYNLKHREKAAKKETVAKQ